MGLDIAAIRNETKGISTRLHLDNCGASLMPHCVIEAVRDHLALEEAFGGYVAQEKRADEVAGFYASMASLLGGKSTDYALAGSAVDAWTKLFYSIAFQRGDNLVTAYNEYCSNFVAYLQIAKRHGVEIRVARAGSDGKLDLDHFENLIDAKTRLITLSHVPSSSGQVNDVKSVGEIAKSHEKLFLLDACQSIGQLDFDVADIGCHMMTGTGRKFLRGPRGVGFLYIDADTRAQFEPVMLTNQSAAWISDDDYALREDAQVYEAWERSVSNQLGLKAAVDYALDLGMENIESRLRLLSDHVRSGLQSIKGVVPTCQDDATAAIITFNKKGYDAAEIKGRFDTMGIGVQIASVVHTRLDLGARGIETTVRVSPHVYNTIDELDRFLNAVDDL